MQEKKQWKLFECPQTVDLANKDLKAGTINMFNELKKAMFKELKKIVTSMTEQREILN